jgi:hypothetical protein
MGIVYRIQTIERASPRTITIALPDWFG